MAYIICHMPTLKEDILMPHFIEHREINDNPQRVYKTKHNTDSPDIEPESFVIFFNKTLGLNSKSRGDLINKIREGLSYESVSKLSKFIDIKESEFCKYIDIPHRTYARRKTEGKFKPDESDRISRVALVLSEAILLFEGDTQRAVKWMSSPKIALGGDTPLEYIDTEIGTQEVRDLISRIEHGVFS